LGFQVAVDHVVAAQLAQAGRELAEEVLGGSGRGAAVAAEPLG
jgi:hypothetical protein